MKKHKRSNKKQTLRRPLGAQNTKTILRELLAQPVSVTNGTSSSVMTTLEVLVRQVFKGVMAGEPRALRLGDKYLDQYSEPHDPAGTGSGYALIPPKLPVEPFQRKLQRQKEWKAQNKGKSPNIMKKLLAKYYKKRKQSE